MVSVLALPTVKSKRKPFLMKTLSTSNDVFVFTHDVQYSMKIPRHRTHNLIKPTN